MRIETSPQPSVRQAQIESSSQIFARSVDLMIALAKNPIVELIFAFALVEKLQERGVFSDVQGTLLEAGIGGIITAQQLAPLMPAFAQGAQGAAALAPLLAMI